MSGARPRGAAAGFVLAALLAFLWVVPGRARAADAYPPLTGRVTDAAHVLTPEVTSDLTQKLAALEQSTGRQLVVATVPSLNDQPIEDYGVGLIRAWAIGAKGRNDGAILIVAPNERKVRIEVGYGLEGDLTDALSERIIQRNILPRFKAGDIPGGVATGADALIGVLQLPADQIRAQSQAAASAPASGEGVRVSARHDPAGLIFAGLFLFWLLSMGWRFLTGHRGRRYGQYGGAARGGGGGLGWLLPMMILNGLGRGGRDDDDGGGWGGFGGGGGGFGGGGGGFSGGGGSGGGGGASGSW